MFYWDEERVRFMEDAAAWGDFHARLAAELAESLPPESCICDAGCGTGHLSLALSPYVRQVTAVDVSQQALSLLADNCRKRNVTNIAIRCGDIHSLPPEQPYDAMVFCFFGRMDEILSLAAAQCRGTVLAVMRSDSCHRFSAGKPTMRYGGYARGRETLRALGAAGGQAQGHHQRQKQRQQSLRLFHLSSPFRSFGISHASHRSRPKRRFWGR